MGFWRTTDAALPPYQIVLGSEHIRCDNAESGWWWSWSDCYNGSVGR